jgi:hypothetical protein
MNDSDVARLKRILEEKQSFRLGQRLRTWEEKVAAIARMNETMKVIRTMRKSLL